MRRPKLQSTWARAVVPVAGGIGFFALLFLMLYGVAALSSGDGGTASEVLAPRYQDMGRLEHVAAAIADGGPLILPDLIGDDRHVVLDHVGADDEWGWAIYLAHPADRDATCTIELVPGTRTFTDCEGRTLTVDDLATPPAGVTPIVNKDGTLTLSLRASG